MDFLHRVLPFIVIAAWSPTQAAEPPRTFTNSIGMRLILIPKGTFTMGSETGDSDEKPVRKVTLTRDYFLGVTEVTNAQWKAVMKTQPSRWPEDNVPVQMVSWDDAQSFCKALSDLPEEQQARRIYRLPTEAEWEYACRAGADTNYCFGNDVSELGSFAWFDDGARSDKGPSEVAKKLVNRAGLYDMHGNVWEWCSDWYGTYANDNSKDGVTDPLGPREGEIRVSRGGSWDYTAWFLRSSYRRRFRPSNRFINVGFRVAMDQ